MSLSSYRSQGSIKVFNRNIIDKLCYIKLEDKDKFDIHKALDRAISIYNNSKHNVTKIEPIKDFHLTRKKYLNPVLENIIKFKININKNCISIEKCTKRLLFRNFLLKGNILSEKKNKKKIYDIPITIIYDKCGVKYRIKCMKNVKGLTNQ